MGVRWHLYHDYYVIDICLGWSRNTTHTLCKQKTNQWKSWVTWGSACSFKV